MEIISVALLKIKQKLVYDNRFRRKRKWSSIPRAPFSKALHARARVARVSELSTHGRPGRETSHGSGEKTPVHGCFPEGTPAGLMFDLRLRCTPLKPWDVRSSKGAWDGRGCYLHFPMNASICINLVSLCMRTLPYACICLKSNTLSL